MALSFLLRVDDRDPFTVKALRTAAGFLDLRTDPGEVAELIRGPFVPHAESTEIHRFRSTGHLVQVAETVRRGLVFQTPQPWCARSLPNPNVEKTGIDDRFVVI